jgi:hypothetical protein
MNLLIDDSVYATGTVSTTPSRLTSLYVYTQPKSAMDSASIGHVTVYSDCYMASGGDAFFGYSGETLTT